MFTGVIEDVGEVLDTEVGGLRIRTQDIVSGIKPGDSIAVNGVDVTVTALEGDTFFVNLMPETYRLTNLARHAPGQRVNLERSIRPCDRLSGHIVRGVVEGTATVVSVEADRDALLMRFRAASDLLRYMVVKGPVAVDGISLTIIDKTEDSFAVSLVQYTRSHTTLDLVRAGDAVNIETDILARYAETFLRRPG